MEKGGPFLLLILSLVSLGGGLTLDDGYDTPDLMVVLRNPFNPAGYVCNYAFNVTSPLDGETYFSNTQEVRVNVSGFNATDCYYVVNGNLPNVWDCQPKNVTFPNGAVSLEVTVVRGFCEKSDTVSFTVVSFVGRRGGYGVELIWLPVLMLLVVFVPRYNV